MLPIYSWGISYLQMYHLFFPTDVSFTRHTYVPFMLLTNVSFMLPTDVSYMRHTYVPFMLPTDVSFMLPTDVSFTRHTYLPFMLPRDVSFMQYTFVPFMLPTDISFLLPRDVSFMRHTYVPFMLPTDVPMYHKISFCYRPLVKSNIGSYLTLCIYLPVKWVTLTSPFLSSFHLSFVTSLLSILNNYPRQVLSLIFPFALMSLFPDFFHLVQFFCSAHLFLPHYIVLILTLLATRTSSSSSSSFYSSRRCCSSIFNPFLKRASSWLCRLNGLYKILFKYHKTMISC